jgi:hypothetical protein
MNSPQHFAQQIQLPAEDVIRLTNEPGDAEVRTADVTRIFGMVAIWSRATQGWCGGGGGRPVFTRRGVGAAK